MQSMPQYGTQQFALGIITAISSRASSSSTSRSASYRLTISVASTSFRSSPPRFHVHRRTSCELEGGTRLRRRARRSHESVCRVLGKVDAARVGPTVSVGNRGRHLEPGFELLDVEVSSVETADLAYLRCVQPFPCLRIHFSSPPSVWIRSLRSGRRRRWSSSQRWGPPSPSRVVTRALRRRGQKR